MKTLLTVFILITSIISAQVEYSHSGGVVAFSSPFFSDIATYRSNSPNKTRVDIYVQVPYSSFSFTKKEDGYYGSYNITLTLFDEKKSNILTEKSWKEKVKVEDFSKTISRNSFSISYKTWDLNPGKYVLKTIFEDIDSRRTSTKETPLELRSIADTLGISDPMLISEIIKDPNGDKIVPNIANTVTNKDNTLSFYFTAYSDQERDVYFEYILTDKQSKLDTKQLSPTKLAKGSSLISFTMDKLKFSLGQYILKIVLKDKDWKVISTVEKNFSAKIYGIPNSINDLDKAIEQLVYIASPKDVDYLKDATDFETKMERFLSFWDNKKPNKESEDNPILYEYYRRVEYSNKNFKGFGEGWRSDMGMIYITFGPPSNVERHPLDADSKPYEIWDYYELNRSFTFIDETGFGDYRLLNPDYSRWPGYRQ